MLNLGQVPLLLAEITALIYFENNGPHFELHAFYHMRGDL